MLAEPRQYTLTDFNACIDRGFQYNLPNEIIENIIQLKEQLTNASDQRRPTSQRPPFGNRTFSQRPPQKQQPSPTKQIVVQLKQEKEGLEKDSSEIRITLNKISPANYQKLLIKIVQIIRTYEQDQLAMNQLVKQIYTIASTNAFLAEICAKLYTDLIDEFEVFGEFLANQVDSADFSYVEPLTDAFEQNKVWDQEKAQIKFYGHLVLLDMISPEKMVKIIKDMLSLVGDHVESREKEPWLVEIAEKVSIALAVAQEPLKGLADWDDLYDLIAGYGEMEVSPGFSRCVLFKFKEMLDRL